MVDKNGINSVKVYLPLPAPVKRRFSLVGLSAFRHSLPLTPNGRSDAYQVARLIITAPVHSNSPKDPLNFSAE